MAGPLLLTLVHHGQELDLEVHATGAVTVGDLSDALIERAELDRLPPTPTVAVLRTGATMARNALVSDCELRSGDRIRLSDASRAEPHTPPQAAAAVAEITEGPDTGRMFELAEGLSDIGRGELCEIRIDDPTASRRHARLRVGTDIKVWDLGSTNGVLVNGKRLEGSSPVTAHDDVTIGATTVRMHLHRSATPRAVGSDVHFNRPPRVFKPFAGDEVKLPAPPEDPPKQYLPMIASVIPLIMGLVMWQVFGSLIFALFMLMSPLMMLGSFYESRKSGRRAHKERLADHAVMLDRSIERLDELRSEEIESRRRESPSASEAAEFALELSPRLWERHIEDDEFLALRLGRAEQQSRTAVSIYPGGSRRMRDELEEIPPRYARIPDLPAVAALREVGGLGVAGPAEAADALARALMVQVGALHAPAEVAVAALLDSELAPQWRWLQWLPHVRCPTTRLAGSHFGHDTRTAALLVASLTEELDRRLAARAARGSRHSSRFSAVVTLIHERALVERSRLTPLLEQGPAVDMYFVWVGTSRRNLPRTCGALIELNIDPREQDAVLGLRSSGDEIAGVSVEEADLAEADRVARALAPVVEVGGRFDSESSVPDTASLIDLLGGPEVTDGPAMILERWQRSEESLRTLGRLNLRAPAGEGAEGPLEVDLRADGPHALVAGTTGSGKSELLQSLVTSLAATHSPKRTTFLLVDYKGGAAFKDCVRLPHTVGLVTDLNTSEVRRALVSLEAELRYRETVLSEADAKDLFELEAMAHPRTPPSLVLVVDEFAALAREVPEFIDGVVDVALRGRSLGIHLVLATQRPAGVITPQIRANTNLRIALRVADDDDSTDVIGSKNAARLPGERPGRAYARIGAREPQLFQAAWAGGITRAQSDEPAVALFRHAFGETSALGRPSAAQASGDRPQDDRTPDLDRLVGTIAEAAETASVGRPRRPWHPPLHPVYDLAALPRAADDTEFVLGMADLPREQRQELTRFRPDRHGSLLVLGASGSGKTVLLRTFAATAGMPDLGPLPHVYGLDFAGRGLDVVAVLPHVGSVVRGDDHERVVRLLRDLRSRITDRGERFAEARAGSLPEFRASPLGNADEPRVFVLLDGYPSFHSAYERVEAGRWIDELNQLVADGRQFGVHFVLTADRRSAFPMALAGTVPARMVLRLTSPEEYSAAGVAPDIVTADSPAGRAVFDGVEVQVALLGGDPAGRAQSSAMGVLANSVGNRMAVPAPSVRILPTDLPADPALSTETAFAIGMRDSDLGPALVAFEPGAFLVAGPPRSGKTTALDTLVATAPPCVKRIVVVSPRPSPLTEHRPGVDTAVGPTQAAELLTSLLRSPVEGLLAIVDDLDLLADTEPDRLVASLMGTTADNASMVVVSASADAARRVYDGALRDARGYKSGLLLQPDTDVDGDIVGTRLPRVVSPAWPPGRGFLVSQGTASLTHVAARRGESAATV